MFYSDYRFIFFDLILLLFFKSLDKHIFFIFTFSDFLIEFISLSIYLLRFYFISISFYRIRF